MKLNYLKILLFIIVLLTGCSPDLTVKSFEQSGPSTINSENSIELPVKVVVENMGKGKAGIFKLSTTYTESSGTYPVQFYVPNMSDKWYPHTFAPLYTKESIIFEGVLIFYPSMQGITISVNAMADSCLDKDNTPEYCRIKESDENNNRSSSLSVVLPSNK